MPSFVTISRTATSKYVILEGLENGNRFITSFSGQPESDIVRLISGKVAYRILGYADTTTDAQRFLFGKSQDELTPAEQLALISEYMKKSVDFPF